MKFFLHLAHGQKEQNADIDNVGFLKKGEEAEMS